MNKKTKNRSFTKLLMALCLGFFINSLMAQTKKTSTMKLKTVSNDMIVNTTPEKAWEILANYGKIGDFHTSVLRSKSINNSSNKAVLGCERECVINEGKKPIIIKERIIEIQDSQYYTYEVYDWKNFPISKMLVTFGVKTDEKGQTVLYQKNNFRLKPGFISGIMKGKIRKGGRDALLAYKHFMETGEKNVAMKTLRKKYKKLKS